MFANPPLHVSGDAGVKRPVGATKNIYEPLLVIICGNIGLLAFPSEATIRRTGAATVFNTASGGSASSVPLDKAMSSTLLAYAMNGAPLPLKHGCPLRALALG
jgi:hypothetical protein